VEGTLTSFWGVVTFYGLTDDPANVGWLSTDQKEWLVQRLSSERSEKQMLHSLTAIETILSVRAWVLGMVWFGEIAIFYSLLLWLPQVVKEFGLSYTEIGLVAGFPSAIAAVLMFAWSSHSDSSGERKWHAVLPLLVTAAAGFLSALSGMSLTELYACLTVDRPQ
jgi:MFS transporter, ACS family, tartrate transporter